MVFVLVSFQDFASKALGLPYLTVCLSTLRDGPLEIVALRLKFKIKSRAKTKSKAGRCNAVGHHRKNKPNREDYDG